MKVRSLALTTTFLLVVVMLVVNVAMAQQKTLPVLDMSGFSWAENLAFDANGNLFVSDATTGKIWRIFLPPNANSYSRTLHLSGFDGCLGLVASEDGQQMFSAVKYKNPATKTTENLIITFDPLTQGKWKNITALPKGGNGLALDFTTDLLYSTTEGSFLPKAGEVFEITMSGTVNTIMKGLYSADGVQIDQQKRLLYVSQVVGAKIIVYDLVSRNITNSFRAPSNVKSIDDFCLTQDGSKIVGADFFNGTVVSFPIENAVEAEIITTGIPKATSVKFGVGPSFNTSSLIVTQGGGLTAFTTSHKVLQVPAPSFLLSRPPFKP